MDFGFGFIYFSIHGIKFEVTKIKLFYIIWISSI